MKLSAVITTRNRREGLHKTLTCLSKQTHQADEIIVCDNATVGGIGDIITDFTDQIPGIKLISHSKNIGMPGNLNAGIAAASGEYIINLHDADEYAETLFKDCVSYLDSHPTAGLVFWGIKDCLWHHVNVADFTKGREFFEKHYLGQTSSVIWGTACVRKTIYDLLMPFDTQWDLWADTDMWMRICKIADIGFIRKELVKLDQSGAHRPFHLERFVRFQKQVLTNILRMTENEPTLQDKWLTLQYKTIQKRFLRHCIGRLRRPKHGSLSYYYEVYRAIQNKKLESLTPSMFTQS